MGRVGEEKRVAWEAQLCRCDVQMGKRKMVGKERLWKQGMEKEGREVGRPEDGKEGRKEG